PVWAKGPDGTPLDANDSDPCIIIEWLDESGTVIYTGWSFWASVDVHYTMRVTDVCENCSWEDDFFYECCGERNFDIQIIYGTQQRDPCDHPGAPFQIGIFDLDDGSLLTSPPYTITWTASDPSALTGLDTDEPTLWANVNVTYYVEIVDELGCVYRDTFEVDCCRAPQNLRCEQNSIGQPVLMWDPVPGVTTFEIFITINDPACCVNPPGLPMSAPIITVTGTSYVLTTNYPCASFRIRSVCGNHYSDFSASECIDCTRRNQGQTLLGGSSSIVDHYLNVFPSPAYDNITVAYEGIELGNILRITDQTGRVVLDEIVETEGTQKLDVSKLPAGVYVVTLMTKQGENPSSKVVILDK
ncbi:MAG: T9SS type A sorting domain-containing protein, partial [Bacteroidia bacterium]